MRDVFAQIAEWQDAGRTFSLATLVELRNAAPAPLGATMAVSCDGAIAGDIGAGCYEGEIVEAALATADDGEPRLLDIDLSDGDIVSGGTGCGGILRVVTWRPGADFERTARTIASGERAASFTVDYRDELLGARTFRANVPARTRLVIVGGTTLAQELAAIASRLDFRVVVVDPRPPFATPARLGAVDTIVVAWPDDVLPGLLDAATPLLVISHDPKLDVPALRCGLDSDAPYIGLLGSRRAQAGRRDALREVGYDEAALARIHGPAGLDLGGVTAAETAMSILAEIVAVARGRAGGSLLAHSGKIHNLESPRKPFRVSA